MKTHKKIILVFVVMLTVCCAGGWKVENGSTTKITIDSTSNAIADTTYLHFLAPYSQNIENQLNIVIGQSNETLAVGRPESLLSNYVSDALRKIAADYLQMPVDVAIMNVGGLRTSLRKGDVTVRHIFEILPFENELLVLYLKGEMLAAVFDEIASVGGEGVSGVQFGIELNKAKNVFIGVEILDPDKIYSVATNDFLAGGNDKLLHLAFYEKRIDTELSLRDAMIDFIKKQTQKNEIIQSKLDGRIYEIK